MKIKLLFLFTFCLSISLSIHAQDENQKNADKELYKSAEELLKRVDKALKSGDLNEAEKLYNQSLKTYPITYGAYNLALKKMEIGDVRGANKLLDNLISSLINHPQVLIEHTTNIGGLIKLSYRASAEYIENVRSFKASTNFSRGDIRVAHSEYMKLIKNGFKGSMNLDSEKGLYVQTLQSCYFTDDVEGLKILKEVCEKAKFDRGIFETKIYVLLVEKKYDEVIGLLTNTLNSGGENFMLSKGLAKTLLPLAYYGKGDTENLAKSIEDIGRIQSVENISYYKSLLALSRKQYEIAIPLLTEAMKPLTVLWAKYPRPGKFRYYTKRAEAYVGIKDFVNARKDYEAALVYNPNYEPALDGLAKLESNQIVEIRKDKTGPEIKILEPTNTRGLKIVAAGKDVMIKGMASDPSGLKSVTINGLSIYVKEAGDFWGTVALVDGVNKFEIIAADLAGNLTKQTFEIEKASATVAVTPVAVTEKQGKNYAVFIASQSYDDSTIPSLENPIADAIKLKIILKNNYNFIEENIFNLFNPQRIDFKKKFLELREALQPEDNLVIFYAGHGIWVDKEKKGYWLLTDALRNDVNTWVPNKEVLDMIAELPARHTLLITDACFSGSVFKSRSIGADAP
ncbi:MAG: caspase family protein, partial [Pyrinomonadaceae bacterium]|nr:caspase family protein [Sphingobacteriaceae bacterium]